MAKPKRISRIALLSMLKAGLRQRTIAQCLSISRRSVYRIQKELTEAGKFKSREESNID